MENQSKSQQPDQSNYLENRSELPEDPNTQVIFDARFGLFMNEFGAICEKENIKLAIAAVIDPKLPKEPMVFMRGHEYDIALLLSKILKGLKAQINKNLQA